MEAPTNMPSDDDLDSVDSNDEYTPPMTDDSSKADSSKPPLQAYEKPKQVRSCDRCKIKKRKCDGLKPCSTCERAQSDCTYEVIPKRRGPAPGSVVARRKDSMANNKGKGDETPKKATGVAKARLAAIKKDVRVEAIVSTQPESSLYRLAVAELLPPPIPAIPDWVYEESAQAGRAPYLSMQSGLFAEDTASFEDSFNGLTNSNDSPSDYGSSDRLENENTDNESSSQRHPSDTENNSMSVSSMSSNVATPKSDMSTLDDILSWTLTLENQQRAEQDQSNGNHKMPVPMSAISNNSNNNATTLTQPRSKSIPFPMSTHVKQPKIPKSLNVSSGFIPPDFAVLGLPPLPPSLYLVLFKNFFIYFHPVFPILDEPALLNTILPTISPKTNPALIAAICAIGATYSRHPALSDGGGRKWCAVFEDIARERERNMPPGQWSDLSICQTRLLLSVFEVGSDASHQSATWTSMGTYLANEFEEDRLSPLRHGIPSLLGDAPILPSQRQRQVQLHGCMAAGLVPSLNEMLYSTTPALTPPTTAVMPSDPTSPWCHALSQFDAQTVFDFGAMAWTDKIMSNIPQTLDGRSVISDGTETQALVQLVFLGRRVLRLARVMSPPSPPKDNSNDVDSPPDSNRPAPPPMNVLLMDIVMLHDALIRYYDALPNSLKLFPNLQVLTTPGRLWYLESSGTRPSPAAVAINIIFFAMIGVLHQRGASESPSSTTPLPSAIPNNIGTDNSLPSSSSSASPVPSMNSESSVEGSDKIFKVIVPHPLYQYQPVVEMLTPTDMVVMAYRAHCHILHRVYNNTLPSLSAAPPPELVSTPFLQTFLLPPAAALLSLSRYSRVMVNGLDPWNVFGTVTHVNSDVGSGPGSTGSNGSVPGSGGSTSDPQAPSSVFSKMPASTSSNSALRSMLTTPLNQATGSSVPVRSTPLIGNSGPILGGYGGNEEVEPLTAILIPALEDAGRVWPIASTYAQNLRAVGLSVRDRLAPPSHPSVFANAWDALAHLDDDDEEMEDLGIAAGGELGGEVLTGAIGFPSSWQIGGGGMNGGAMNGAMMGGGGMSGGMGGMMMSGMGASPPF
ncbi:hypothetical protein SmJEL517_g06104 [Synchytrium microbalum]|uniref:Zn(2)-C6 fungal-type domain-containing protein n=1 Tax=Synchytrium microbalum TaxID=1806994 RepID=A0A507BX45_9FUNG|nr:uncharacterized protein SmJEL517_g06104 [Synchytrium microbalum]TPX30306.1 hypothetical protein SmJEL517_g06104 [Synchytrium microbalum]